MTNTHTNGCGSDVAAYALGALTDEETQRFEQHLETCELCRSDLAALRPVVDALPAAAEPVQPPPALKKRIMSVVEAEARDRKRAEQPRRRPLFSFRPLPALAAACALLLAGAAIGLAVLQDDARTVDGQILRAAGSVEMRVEDDHGTLKIARMQPPPSGRVYQVWTQRADEAPRPTDALFTVDEDGSASVDVPGDVDGFDQVLVTDEPPGGSRRPTTEPYLSVRV